MREKGADVTVRNRMGIYVGVSQSDSAQVKLHSILTRDVFPLKIMSRDQNADAGTDYSVVRTDASRLNVQDHHLKQVFDMFNDVLEDRRRCVQKKSGMWQLVLKQSLAASCALLCCITYTSQTSYLFAGCSKTWTVDQCRVSEMASILAMWCCFCVSLSCGLVLAFRRNPPCGRTRRADSISGRLGL